MLPESEKVADASAELAAEDGDDSAEDDRAPSIRSDAPMAVVNMAGAALARIECKLSRPERRAACDDELEPDVEVQPDDSD